MFSSSDIFEAFECEMIYTASISDREEEEEEKKGWQITFFRTIFPYICIYKTWLKSNVKMFDCCGEWNSPKKKNCCLGLLICKLCTFQVDFVVFIQCFHFIDLKISFPLHWTAKSWHFQSKDFISKWNSILMMVLTFSLLNQINFRMLLPQNPELIRNY